MQRMAGERVVPLLKVAGSVAMINCHAVLHGLFLSVRHTFCRNFFCIILR